MCELKKSRNYKEKQGHYVKHNPINSKRSIDTCIDYISRERNRRNLERETSGVSELIYSLISKGDKES
ncbi:hypothetical protein L1987_35387 [Smallanthus sonchifolius]|uniref:Uncharacterized protein n=1 Tax=Smallanthus sonchifolius TaxID=185202 RepID=A0ACB9HVV2_9ASTR|nr:hypothetical protein L1987_35387 [Smallanthus sonchifolius]